MAAMVATIFVVVMATTAAAAVELPTVAEALAWPASVGGEGYFYGNNLGPGAQDTFTMTIPVLPPSVPAQVYSAMALTAQCVGCIGGLCLTVITSGAGCPSNTYCDDKVYTCTDPVPFSSNAQSTYEVIMANEGSMAGALLYTIQLTQTCADGGQLDQYACMPTTATPNGTYADAVVFDSPAGGLMFGVDGCSGQTDGAYYSGCWNGVPVAQVQLSNGVQSCAPPACAASPQPSPSATSLPSHSPAPTPSHSWTPAPSNSSTPSPSHSSGGGGAFHIGPLAGAPAYVVAASMAVSVIGGVTWVGATLQRRAIIARQRARGIAMQRLRDRRARDEVAVSLLAVVRVCRACHTRNVVGDRFCDSCGAPLVPEDGGGAADG